MDRYPTLAAPARADLLRVLRAASMPMSVAELASVLGSHRNTCREHLARLLDAGLVTRTPEHTGRRGRPSWRYAATPAAMAEAPTGVSALARALVDHLGASPDATTQAVDAGRRWAGTLQPTDGRTAEPTELPADGRAPMARLLALFEEAGFAPEAPTRPGGPIGLRACPFGLSPRDGSRVACRVHRGLIAGVLEGLGAPADEVVLEPFVRPDLCLAHVGAVGRG